MSDSESEDKSKKGKFQNFRHGITSSFFLSFFFGLWEFISNFNYVDR